MGFAVHSAHSKAQYHFRFKDSEVKFIAWIFLSRSMSLLFDFASIGYGYLDMYSVLNTRDNKTYSLVAQTHFPIILIVS